MKRNIIKTNQDNLSLKTNYIYHHNRDHNRNKQQDISLSPVSFFSNTHTDDKKNNEYQIEEDGLLCQNCINRKLIQDKESKRIQEERESVINNQYNNDLIYRLKQLKETTIANQINKREIIAKEIGKNLLKFQIKSKDELIDKNEQPEVFIKENNYDCYLKARQLRNNNENMIQRNIDKFVIKDNQKDDYFAKYIDKRYDNPFINSYESDDYQKNLRKYHNDLRKQIEDNMVNRNKKYEKDLLNDHLLIEKNNQQSLKENHEIEAKKRNKMNKLREYNSMMIKEKNDRLNREHEMNKEDDIKYRRKIKQELDDYHQMKENKKRNMMKEYKNFLDLIVKEKEKKKRINYMTSSQNNIENYLLISNYNKDSIHQCFICHQKYPKKILTKNPFAKAQL